MEHLQRKSKQLREPSVLVILRFMKAVHFECTVDVNQCNRTAYAKKSMIKSLIKFIIFNHLIRLSVIDAISM